jgi:hypothetical protein
MTDLSSAPPPEFFADRCLGRTTVTRLQSWALLTKDKKIRYQPAFDAASTPVFALSVGTLTIDEMVQRFEAGRPRIWLHAHAVERQFWIVYDGGRVERRA